MKEGRKGAWLSPLLCRISVSDLYTVLLLSSKFLNGWEHVFYRSDEYTDSEQ